MLYYGDLKRIEDAMEKKRAVEGLIRLREGLTRDIPPKSGTDKLLLATWNIREFDSGKYGYRPPEAYYCIAEIISRFDLVAIQEVKNSLYPLQRLRELLGSWWDYLVTDVTLGDAGASERMAFFYDTRKVTFTRLAAELSLPKVRGAEVDPRQFARSPYIAGFRAGWASLTLATVHIYYGDGTRDNPRRLEEITEFAELLAKHAPRFSSARVYGPEDKPRRDNLIVLGDFNIFDPNDVTMKALNSAGFLVPPQLQSLPGSNVARDRYYDQVAFFKELSGMRPTGQAGVFDYFEHVYRLEDASNYDNDRKEKPGKSFKEWRTYRMSDHLPMWIEFDIDDSATYLKSMI